MIGCRASLRPSFLSAAWAARAECAVSESVGGRLLRASARSRKRRKLAGTALGLAAPLLPRRRPVPQPVFVLGSPRSGTTLLFDVLNSSPQTASLQAESHLLWEMFHPLGPPRWTHEVAPSDLSPKERRVLLWAVDRVAMGRRYVDKAPRNCLRVPYLRALFPDAWFVHVKRDGRAAVSSLITGWRDESGMFPGMDLPGGVSIRGYDGATWKFLVPQGWRAYARGSSLAEVCAFQWVAANEGILAARESLGIERWVEVRYEEFVASPAAEAGRLFETIGLPLDPRVLDYAGSLDRRVSKAVSPPRLDKWRQENPEEIAGIVELIEPMMRRLGYELEKPRRRL